MIEAAAVEMVAPSAAVVHESTSLIAALHLIVSIVLDARHAASIVAGEAEGIGYRLLSRSLRHSLEPEVARTEALSASLAVKASLSSAIEVTLRSTISSIDSPILPLVIHYRTTSFPSRSEH